MTQTAVETTPQRRRRAVLVSRCRSDSGRRRSVSSPQSNSSSSNWSPDTATTSNSIQQTSREEESSKSAMYSEHLSTLGAVDLLKQNAVFRQRLRSVDSKIAEVLNENKYLRWEREQLQNNRDEIQKQLDAKSLTVAELRAELHCLRANQTEINRISAAKLVSLKFGTFFRIKEQQMEFDCRVREEINKAVSAVASDRDRVLDRLTEDNRILYKKLAESRRRCDDQIAKSVQRESDLRIQIESLQNPKEESEKGVRFGTVDRISANGSIFRQTVAEWEEKFTTLRKECEMEREQRKQLCRVLTEMGRDMKTLIAHQHRSPSLTPNDLPNGK